MCNSYHVNPRDARREKWWYDQSIWCKFQNNLNFIIFLNGVISELIKWLTGAPGKNTNQQFYPFANINKLFTSLHFPYLLLQIFWQMMVIWFLLSWLLWLLLILKQNTNVTLENVDTCKFWWLQWSSSIIFHINKTS
jgi:hypothetical protein